MITVEEGAVGHYRTVAGALAFVGFVGLSIGTMAASSATPIGFIDASALVGFSLLFLSVAAAMAVHRDD